MDTAKWADELALGEEAPPRQDAVPGVPTGEWDLEWVFRRLSETPRWLEQATDRRGRTLTVAHHSLWCLKAAWRLLSDRPRDLRAGTALWALLHDCHEAWTGDMPRSLQLRSKRLKPDVSHSS